MVAMPTSIAVSILPKLMPICKFQRMRRRATAHVS